MSSSSVALQFVGRICPRYFHALAALVQNKLGLDPHPGLIVVFRSKRMDRLKILPWDGTGLVLIYKRLGDSGFSWPQISDGVLQSSRVQFEELFEGASGSHDRASKRDLGRRSA